MDNHIVGDSDLCGDILDRFAQEVKMAFYYHFDEIIPSIMADKIDEIKDRLRGTINEVR